MSIVLGKFTAIISKIVLRIQSLPHGLSWPCRQAAVIKSCLARADLGRDRSDKMGLARAAQMLALAPVLAAPAAHAGNTVPPARLENPLAAIPLSQLVTTRDRPLFVPDRRPPPPVAVARDTSPPPPAEPPSLSLLAIILDGHQRAIVRAEDTGKILRLQIGDNIDGWRIARIEKQRIEIVHDSRAIDITMFKNDQPKQKLAGGAD